MFQSSSYNTGGSYGKVHNNKIRPNMTVCITASGDEK